MADELPAERVGRVAGKNVVACGGAEALVAQVVVEVGQQSGHKHLGVGVGREEDAGVVVDNLGCAADVGGYGWYAPGHALHEADGDALGGAQEEGEVIGAGVEGLHGTGVRHGAGQVDAQVGVEAHGVCGRLAQWLQGGSVAYQGPAYLPAGAAAGEPSGHLDAQSGTLTVGGAGDGDERHGARGGEIARSADGHVGAGAERRRGYFVSIGGVALPELYGAGVADGMQSRRPGYGEGAQASATSALYLIAVGAHGGGKAERCERCRLKVKPEGLGDAVGRREAVAAHDGLEPASHGFGGQGIAWVVEGGGAEVGQCRGGEERAQWLAAHEGAVAHVAAQYGSLQPVELRAYLAARYGRHDYHPHPGGNGGLNLGHYEGFFGGMAEGIRLGGEQ